MTSWISRKKKECIFLTFILSKEIFLNIIVLYQCIVYWINFQSIYYFQNYIYISKSITLYTFIVFFKSVESLECILNPAGTYMFNVNNRNTRTRYEICSKLAIKTPQRRQWRLSDIFIVYFEYISHFVLLFLLLTLSR